MLFQTYGLFYKYQASSYLVFNFGFCIKFDTLPTSRAASSDGGSPRKKVATSFVKSYLTMLDSPTSVPGRFSRVAGYVCPKYKRGD